MRRKIILLSDFPVDGIGGAEKSLMTVAEILYDEGMEVHILTPDINSKPNPNYVYHYFGKHLDTKFVLFWRKVYHLMKVINEVRPDYVNAQFSQYGFVLIISKGFGILPKKSKYIFTDRDFLNAYNKKYHMIFKLFAHKLDRIVCTTSINEALWKTANSKVRTFVIHNVLEEQWYSFSKEKKNEVRKKNKYDDKTFVLGFSGRYASWKRWDDVYKICEQFKDDDRVRFEIAIAAHTDEEMYHDMLEYIDKMKKTFDNKINIIINSNINEMDEFYYKLDCFVLTSQNESFGRTLLEAAARKNILISTNSGGAPEVVGRKSNLYDVGNIQQVTGIIKNYISNKQKCEEDKEFFYDRLMTVFNREIFKHRNIKLYDLQ